MNPQELLQTGELAQAIEAQTARVKARPTDLDERHLLCVLLCFAGDLDRAFLQLNVMTGQDPELGMGLAVYRSLVVAEAARRSFFGQQGRPLLPPNSPPSLDHRLAALEALRRGDVPAAEAALALAQTAEAPLEAKLNGDPVRGVRDYDDFLGPVLEVYAGGNYLWLPLQHVRRLEIPPPAHQLDLLWAPATLVDVNGNEAAVHLPALYEGSHLAEDARIRLGRMTDWVDRAGLGFRGLGQKVLLADSGRAEGARELGLLELRTFERPAAGAAEASGG
jgi:type VI secretion system protein ImpE